MGLTETGARTSQFGAGDRAQRSLFLVHKNGTHVLVLSRVIVTSSCWDFCKRRARLGVAEIVPL